jgi:hypothetical protein
VPVLRPRPGVHRGAGRGATRLRSGHLLRAPHPQEGVRLPPVRPGLGPGRRADHDGRAAPGRAGPEGAVRAGPAGLRGRVEVRRPPPAAPARRDDRAVRGGGRPRDPGRLGGRGRRVADPAAGPDAPAGPALVCDPHRRHPGALPRAGPGPGPPGPPVGVPRGRGLPGRRVRLHPRVQPGRPDPVPRRVHGPRPGRRPQAVCRRVRGRGHPRLLLGPRPAEVRRRGRRRGDARRRGPRADPPVVPGRAVAAPAGVVTRRRGRPPRPPTGRGGAGPGRSECGRPGWRSSSGCPTRATRSAR